jgi:hypothetical protein
MVEKKQRINIVSIRIRFRDWEESWFRRLLDAVVHAR